MASTTVGNFDSSTNKQGQKDKKDLKSQKLVSQPSLIVLDHNLGVS
jgi:hypothetical protein